ncbi:MAG: amino acid-binding protein [Bdellovibrionaceae bacterium]|nr:amino acid-binding protein [Pseudobdellovibrionaceae bacterium]|tara:strand:- start:954 stop:1343 length:390 start_codon:yes stop_codon:yes gene_type:complete
MQKLTLTVQPSEYSIVKLPIKSKIPPEVFESKLYSITQTQEELSIVTESYLLKQNFNSIEEGFSLIKVEGPLDFSLTGILSKILEPLAKEKISIFALSTFDTDYILVRKSTLQKTIQALRSTGMMVNEK